MKPEESNSQEPPMENEMDPISQENMRIEGEIRKLGASTIGEFLKYKRQARNLTLDEIDLMTHIGPRWTEAIEEGTWSIYPSMLYAKGHIRGYCEALEIPSEILLAYYSKELINAFPEETFHPHPVLQVNQILQDSTSSARNNTSSGGSRLLLWLLAGFIILIALLGSLKVWMDKAEKRHSAEKATPLTKKVAPPKSTIAPPPGGPSATPPAVQPAPAPLLPSVVTPAPSSPSPNSSSGSGTGNQGTGATSPVSPTSLHETPDPSSHVDQPSSSETGPETISAPSVNSVPAQKEQPPLFHKLKVTALKDTYVAVKEGDGRARRYALIKGKSKVFRSKTEFWISTRDAGAILLSLDDHALGPAGPENKSVQHKKVVFKK